MGRSTFSCLAAFCSVAFIAPSRAADSAVVEIGRTRVLAIPLASPPPADLTVKASAGGEIAVLGPAQFSQPAQRAFIRVRGEKAGTANLSIAGADLSVQVIPRRTHSPDPVIFAPADGACVWGTFSVGIEVDAETASSPPSLSVSLEDGSPPRTISPSASSDASAGPTLNAVFEIDASKLTGESIALRASVNAPDGSVRTSDPVILRLLHPETTPVQRFEGEATYDIQRPKRFAASRQSIGSDPACSGGRYFYNYSSEPALCLPLKVEAPGWYQVMGSFSGDPAAGALPTVSLILDGGQYGLTNARLVTQKWHRIPLGVPVQLAAGDHVLTPYFENDFYVEGKADRNLKIDYIELARLGDAAAPSAAGGSMMAMAAMTPMTSMTSMTSAAMTKPRPDGAMVAMSPITGRPITASEFQTLRAPDLNRVSDPWGALQLPLRVAFERPLDNEPVAGDLRFSARCWWNGQEQAGPAALITVMVNGNAVATQYSAAPRFELDASVWRPGANTIQLIARRGSDLAFTPVQRMIWDGPSAAPIGPHWLRYTVHDPAWNDAARTLAHSGDCDERASFNLFSDSTIALTLPDDLEGQFQILLDGRGQEFDGPPKALLTLVSGDTRRDLATIDIPTWWGEHDAGKFDCAKGPKQLLVSFTNDKFEEGKGDRNLWLQAVSLRRIPTSTDTVPPVVRILYPHPAQPWKAQYADAVVIEAADDTAIHEAELIIDGVQTGQSRWMHLETGRVVIPILARNLDVGTHTIAVRVRDAAGNTATSEPRTFERLKDPPSEPTEYQRAVRLLDRFAFGPDEHELAAVLSEGAEPWLRRQLWDSADRAGELAAIGRGLVFFRNARSEYEVKGRALQQALLTDNPVRARFVFWAQNHFSTWVNKIEGERKWAEHTAFSRLGPAPFSDLLLTSATGPAMLRYLDQERSFAGRLNENYAREVMELHTLGVHGGYSQTDVTTLAHLLTGWTAAQEGDGHSPGEIRNYAFRFDPALNEGQEMNLLGVKFPPADRADRYQRVRAALELLAAHPSTARFVCGKLVAHYVSAPPDDALVTDLAGVFESSGGDLREVLFALARHPRFWSAPRLAHPLDFGLRLSRISSANNPWLMVEFLQRSGCGLFDRATPDGYPENDAAYSDSNALVQRWRLAHELRWALSNLCLPRLRWGSAPQDPAWAQNVIDSIAIRLTGNVLESASNTSLLEAAAKTTGSPADRVRALAELIAQMPEANLR